MGNSRSKDDRQNAKAGRAVPFMKPIVASVVFSAIFTYLTISAIVLAPIEFVPESEGGIFAAGINAIILSVLPLIGGFVILFILRKRRQLLLKAFIGTGFVLAGSTIFSIIIGSALMVTVGNLQSENAFMIAIPLGLALNIILVYIILSTRVSQGAKNLAAVVYGGGIGTLLGTTLPLWTGLLMVMGISIYDIYSVRSGPIKEIVKVSKDRQEVIPGLSYVSSDWEIGLGDLGIYSMLISLAETQFGLIACIFSIVGIIIGSILTLQLLKKREFLPGLPITSLIGAVPIVVFMILSI
ncbi:MAG: hypothetical protein WED04_02530 [Promethearchaeati archaeon SRVP18_Atabeyarchaeia-1]